LGEILRRQTWQAGKSTKTNKDVNEKSWEDTENYVNIQRLQWENRLYMEDFPASHGFPESTQLWKPYLYLFIKYLYSGERRKLDQAP
jgi:hypothetical protein